MAPGRELTHARAVFSDACALRPLYPDGGLLLRAARARTRRRRRHRARWAGPDLAVAAAYGMRPLRSRGGSIDSTALRAPPALSIPPRTEGPETGGPGTAACRRRTRLCGGGRGARGRAPWLRARLGASPHQSLILSRPADVPRSVWIIKRRARHPPPARPDAGSGGESGPRRDPCAGVAGRTGEATAAAVRDPAASETAAAAGAPPRQSPTHRDASDQRL